MHKPDNQFANIQPPHRQEETQAAQVAARRICLLGDNALLARDTALQLQCLGYEVAIATQLEQLAALLAKQDVSCIVVDHSGRGSRFADPAGVAQIRSRCETPVPILWFASRNNFEARLAVARAGVDGYLAKPADTGALKECIESLVQRMGGQAYRVLVVGSDAARLDGLERLLAQAGMEAMRLQKPLDLAATLSQNRPELIVIDVHTPACNGVDLTMLIRQDKAFLDLPVLVLSEDKSPDIRRRAVAAGVDDFLLMPLSQEDLIFSISSRIERSRALRALIMRDGLTGLYNHNSIKEQLVREIARSKREGCPLSLAMVDLDFFKKINDSYGHPVGDQVIRAISRILRQRLRQGDLVGRYGGEEFAVILPSTSAAAAAGVLNEIREAFGKVRHRTDDTEFFASFSAGVAELNDATGLDDASEMFRLADMALYQAKQAGRNRVEMVQRHANAFVAEGNG
ncbi:MAG TPA: diguanylate cyclase [Noviherbaspirillum sp.]